MSLVIDPEEKGASLAAEIQRTLLPIRTFGGLLGFAISPQVAAVTRRWSGRRKIRGAVPAVQCVEERLGAVSCEIGSQNPAR